MTSVDALTKNHECSFGNAKKNACSKAGTPCDSDSESDSATDQGLGGSIITHLFPNSKTQCYISKQACII